MEILYTLKQLFHQHGNLVLSEINLIQVMEKFTTAHTLHRDEDPFVCLKVLEHLDYVWV